MRRGHAVVVALAISNLIAGIALVLSVAILAQRQKTTNQAVKVSAYNTCNLITSVIGSFHTPQGRKAAHEILRLNPELKNCVLYAAHPRVVRK